MAVQRDEGEVGGWGGGGGEEEVGGINRNKDKGQWRESGGQRRRRRVEGTEVRWRGALFASCYIRSRLAAAVQDVCDDDSGHMTAAAL